MLFALVKLSKINNTFKKQTINYMNMNIFTFLSFEYVLCLFLNSEITIY